MQFALKILGAICIGFAALKTLGMIVLLTGSSLPPYPAIWFVKQTVYAIAAGSVGYQSSTKLTQDKNFLVHIFLSKTHLLQYTIRLRSLA